MLRMFSINYSRSDFQSALGMKNSTFVDRLFAVFDDNGDGGINFVEFLTILSVLSTKVSTASFLSLL
jgi:Ca2+-binding EF-hand superfamily protein